jgi:hypothetical protein
MVITLHVYLPSSYCGSSTLLSQFGTGMGYYYYYYRLYNGSWHNSPQLPHHTFLITLCRIQFIKEGLVSRRIDDD